jgi:hypothetical protein
MTAQGDSAAFEGDNALILYSSTNVYTCNTLITTSIGIFPNDLKQTLLL